MENLEVIISVAGTAVGLLATTITFLLKFLSNFKEKKKAQQIIKIGNTMLPYIEQAETFLNYSGAEKKEFVLTKANRYAIEQGIEFDAKLVGEKIEELVKFTKQVNVREKDKDKDKTNLSTQNILR